MAYLRVVYKDQSNPWYYECEHYDENDSSNEADEHVGIVAALTTEGKDLNDKKNRHLSSQQPDVQMFVDLTHELFIDRQLISVKPVSRKYLYTKRQRN